MKKPVLFFIIAFILIALPTIVLAISEHPLGEFTSPGKYINALYAWGLGMVGAVAVTAIAYGGVYYMTGDTKKGKEIILDALLGLLLLFGAWLILYTINPDLATFKDPLEGASTPSDTPPPSPPPGPSSSADQQVRDQILAAGVSVNKTCTNTDATTCLSQTCLDGLTQDAISGVTAIKQSCGCSVTITAGTEGGCHASGANSHESGKKLDLRPETQLDSYIQLQGCGKIPQDTNCKGKDGNTYRYETAGGAHWDVCFKC